MPINMSKDWNIQKIIYFFFLIMHFSVFETLRKKYLGPLNDWNKDHSLQSQLFGIKF